MNIQTYIILMSGATLYSVAHAVMLWSANRLLFWVAIIVTAINGLRAVLQMRFPEDLEIRSVVFYLIPGLLLVLSQVMGHAETDNFLLIHAGANPLPLPLPGTSEDYESAFRGHFVSMFFPSIAYGIAWVVDQFIGCCSRNSN